tara:strand:- start:3791 stop:4195 length:405 start_codon:yes stop_codon:yes gene_type:complete
MDAYDADNVFLKIINNEVPSTKVYTDEEILVIMDAFPQEPGHMLVIPRKEVRNILDIDNSSLNKLILMVKKIANAQIKAFNASGIKIVHNCESAAGQVVFHAHFHVLPYFAENNEMPTSLDTPEKQALEVAKHL